MARRKKKSTKAHSTRKPKHAKSVAVKAKSNHKKKDYKGVILLGFIVLCIVVFIAGSMSQKPKQKTYVAPSSSVSRKAVQVDVYKQHKNRIMHTYLKLHEGKVDSFWLYGTESFNQQGDKMKKKLDHLSLLMKKSAGVSPLATQLYRETKKVQLSKFANGASLKFFNGKFEDLGKDTIEICMIPMDQYQIYRQKIPAALWYRKDWKALMITAIDFSDAFLTALVYHEMGHWLRHKQGASSATAMTGSDSFISEEVEMHELEYKVLNFFSKGKLKKLMKSICARSKSKENPKDALNYVTRDDLVAFDVMLGTVDAGQRTIGTYGAQFLTSVGLECINQNTNSDQAKAKIKYYRWLSQ